MAKLQRSMKEEEQRRKKSLLELVRWRNGGELADRDPISPAMSRKGAATAALRPKMLDIGEERRRREGRRRRRRRFSDSVVLTEESPRKKRAEEEEGVGGKKVELPPLPYLYRGATVVEHYHRAHDPDRSCQYRHVVARRGAAVCITVPLGP
jgi:hypothetical protein